MATELSAQLQSFIDGRANLRSLTKWLLSGIGGGIALVIGASTFSNLGSLGLGWRLAVAAVCLAIATGVCWLALRQAIQVLRSEVLTLDQFTDATSGDLADALKKVSDLLEGQLKDGSGKPLSVKEFAKAFPTLRSEAWAKALAEPVPDAVDRAREAVAALDERRRVVQQACLSALVELRFEKFWNIVGSGGLAALVALLLFVYAANPPKAADGKVNSPIVVSLSPDTIKALAGLPRGGCCACPAGQPPGVACPPSSPSEPTPPTNWGLVLLGWIGVFAGLTVFLYYHPVALDRSRAESP
jgi:hypothetical protein